MPFDLTAECPCCGVKAEKNLSDIEIIFGFWNMGDGRTIPQSYCKRCRSLACSSNDKKCKKGFIDGQNKLSEINIDVIISSLDESQRGEHRHISPHMAYSVGYFNGLQKVYE